MAPSASTAKKLAIALDTDDLDQALDWAASVAGIVGIAKVGLQLFTACGPRAVEKLSDTGLEIFLDLKFHDIPTTVEKACRESSRLGVSYVTVHSSGGVAMVKAALNGLGQGATERGHHVPQLLGVTILTSAEQASESDLAQRISILLEAGANGLVCAATDLPFICSFAPTLTKVVPGIRRRFDDPDDQARTATPEIAVAAGADILVIGRPITSSSNPRQAALEISSAIEFA